MSEQIQEEGITGIMVSSGVSGKTRQPFVQMLIAQADWMTQMSPEKAREVAHNLLGAADAAESDGFLVEFLQKRIGVDDERAIITVLMEFRQWRDRRRVSQETEGQDNGHTA